MKTIIACGLLLLTCGCFTINQRHYDDQGRVIAEGPIWFVGGRQTGEWVLYYDSGERKAKGQYHDDVQAGPWTFYYRSGKTEMEGEFVHEQRDGHWTYFHPNGQLSAEGEFREGFQVGPWVFYGSEGKKTQEGFFADGTPHLEWSYYFADGKPKAKGQFLMGRKVGVWDYWTSQGEERQRKFDVPKGYVLVQEPWGPDDPKLRREGFTHDGHMDGYWASYHENGRLRLAGKFAADQPVGTWEAWSPAGELIASGRVEKGRLAGDWTFVEETKDGPVRHHRTLDGTRPLPPYTGEWSHAADVADLSPEEKVELWLSELGSAPGFEETLEPTLPVASAATVESAKREFVPTPDTTLTVREQKDLGHYVANYGMSPPRPVADPRYPGSGGPRTGDRTKAKPIEGKPLPVTTLNTADGKIDLTQYHGKKNVILVILRGFAGRVCVYCLAQIKAYDDPEIKAAFAARDAVVVVVYPGPEDNLGAFVKAYTREFDRQACPYPLVYDSGMALTGDLGLRADKAIPTTLIIDKKGIVRFAYVGKNVADRAPANIIEKELDKIEAE